MNSVIALFVFLTAIAGLRSFGRSWGRFDTPWVGDTYSKDISLGWTDPYTFSHVLHGLLFYWLGATLGLSGAHSLTLAVVLEAIWELAENTPYVIDRYRNTVSKDYMGDSVLNSAMDILTMAAGWYLASKLSVRWSVLIFFAVEAGMILKYKDNLTLNVLMLIHPFQKIKEWQSSKARS